MHALLDWNRLYNLTRIVLLFLLGTQLGSRVTGASESENRVEVIPTQTCRSHIASESLDPVNHSLVGSEYPAASGTFPVITNEREITYDIITYDYPNTTTATIDDMYFLASGDMMVSEFNSVSQLDVSDAGSIGKFFADWSFCINHLSLPAATEMFTSFGWNWMLSGADRFRIYESAASVLAGGSLSRSVGALPLELFAFRELEDGRMIVVTSDGSKHNSSERGFGNEGEGTLWILRPHGDSWLIDGIVGNFKATASKWIELPLE